jgi:hypothetical protein
MKNNLPYQHINSKQYHHHKICVYTYIYVNIDINALIAVIIYSNIKINTLIIINIQNYLHYQHINSKQHHHHHTICVYIYVNMDINALIAIMIYGNIKINTLLIINIKNYLHYQHINSTPHHHHTICVYIYM